MEKVIQLQDLQPGTSYLIRARAINKFGVVSEWSQTFTLNVINDDLKPSIPAAPTIQIAGPQKIVVSHDNTKDGGGDLEYDIAAYKVFENAVDNNTTGTLIHTMSATRPGSGLDSFATVNVDVKDSDPSATRYYYVTAVDVAGNESDPSPTATGVNITFFESAYISDLTADKIKTGTLQANESISVGTLSPIIIKSNAASPRGQIYIGAGNYAQSDTAFYVDSTGKFSLKDALTWDGTTLSINGYLQVGEALETGDAADDVNNNPTTIVGDKIRTGNLISNNYLRIDPALDTGGFDGIPNNGDPNTQPTDYSYSGTWIDLDDGSIWSKNFYIDTLGNAVFKGNLFASRGIFSDYLTEADGADVFNYKDPGDTSEQLRYPTLTVESTNTDDGYLVLFKNVGTDNGIEFYVKQGPETPENDQKNWRRGSLAHISDGEGGFVRLGAFPSSTGLTPGRLRIFSQDSPSGPKGEIYLDASRTYAQRLFITQPTTTGDFVTDPITNFWKDPDGVSNGDNYFKVGSTIGPAVIVKKDSSGLDKVIIKDYEIEGVATIIDDSKITVNTVEIGKGVGGAGKHGIRIDGSNYWYDPAPLNATDVVFRAGGSSSESLTVKKDGTVLFEGTTNPTGGEIKGLLVIKDVSDALTFEIGKNVDGGRDGIRLNANNYWTISQTAKTAEFRFGGNSRYLEWDGSSLSISTDSVTIGGINAATTSYADTAASNAAASVNVVQKWNSGQVTGVTLTSLGEIYTASKTSYTDTDPGWYLGWDNPSNILTRNAVFNIGNSTQYVKWTGAELQIQGSITGSTFVGGTFRTGGTLENRVQIEGGSNQDRIKFPLLKTIGGATLNPEETDSAYIRIIPTNAPDGSYARLLELASPEVPGFMDRSFIRLMTGTGVGAGNTSRLIFDSDWIFFGSESVQMGFIPDYTGTSTSATRVLGTDFGYRLAWFDAADFAGGGSGTGTVTSVGLTVPSGFSVSGSPITTSGTLAISLGNAPASSQVLRSGSTTAAGWGQITGNHINNASTLDVSQVKASGGLFHDGATTEVEAWYGTRVAASSIPSAANYPDNTLLVVI